MRQLKGKAKVSQRYSRQTSHSIKRAGNGVCLNGYKGSQPIFMLQENAREKKERKKEFLENKEKAWTVAMPTLGVIFLFVILYVWLNSRPKVIVEQRLLLIISFIPFKHFLSHLETGNNSHSKFLKIINLKLFIIKANFIIFNICISDFLPESSAMPLLIHEITILFNILQQLPLFFILRLFYKSSLPSQLDAS